MERHDHDGLTVYRFASLSRYPEISHGIFTRAGGVSSGAFASLNLGRHVGDRPEAVAENAGRVVRAMGFAPEAVAQAQLVHGHRLAVVAPATLGDEIPETDALISALPGSAVLFAVADCVAILLYDPVRRTIGLAHAGWRGTLQQIAVFAVNAMHDAFGTRPRDLVAALGPSIGPCCFRLRAEMVDALRAAWPGGLRHVLDRDAPPPAFDLWQANHDQLAGAGVETIESARLCTACHTDAFFSWQAEAKTTGRFGVFLGLHRAATASEVRDG